MRPSQPGAQKECPFTVVDLFSGCGGLSLGFHRAGARILGGVDSDPVAARTFALNFCPGDEDAMNRWMVARDISRFGPDLFCREILEKDGRGESVDIIVAGPPCQAFARIGRAKLREIMRDPTAHLNDGRAGLYTHLIQYVAFFRPAAVLLENVPEMMKHGGQNVAEEIACTLEEMGYTAAYTLLNAAHYGVPQLRTRLFLLALRSDLGVAPSFPGPTHRYDLPRGHVGGYLSLAPASHLWEQTHYIPPPVPGPELPSAVTVQEAIGDLPPITAHLHAPIRGPRRLDIAVPYARGKEYSDFVREMREWPGFEASGEGVFGHVIRYLPRDHEIFRRMQPDDQYPEALAIAEQIFQEKLAAVRANTAREPAPGSREYDKLRKKTVPPYDPSKFPNRWRKLNYKHPAHTLTAHLGKDTYSHIHPDSDQARVISVREAARLQSFPDGFVFAGRMNATFRQIGNAVPPILSRVLAKHIDALLKTAGATRKTQEPAGATR